jgi:hypothetical protein
MKHDQLIKQLSFVQSIAEFNENFEQRFKCSTWITAIDFEKFHISGGCVVNCLCQMPFASTDLEPVDINFNGDSVAQFDDAVAEIFAKLISISSNNGYICPTLAKKSNGTYSVLLPSQVTLRFIHKDVSANGDPVNYVLHSSDLDISQVALTGETSGRKEMRRIIRLISNRYTRSMHICFPASNGDQIVCLLHHAWRYGQKHLR